VGLGACPAAPASGHEDHAGPPLAMRVLLVDDSPVNLRVTSLMLERAGHRVVPAARARDALRLLEASSFDLVLMDVEMPDMDGRQATALLRGLGLVDLPVIALTAHSDLDQRERCLQAGMNDVLCKPFKLRDLVATVERWARWPPAVIA